MRKFELSRAEFPLVYDQGLRVVKLSTDQLEGNQIAPQSLLYFSEHGRNRNFVAYCQAVTFVPGSSGGDGLHLVHIGEPLLGVKLWSDLSAEEKKEQSATTLAFYKQLNGTGHWLEIDATGQKPPAMIMSQWPGGQLMLAPGGNSVAKLYDFDRRPGGKWATVDEQKTWSVHVLPGQFRNYFNPA